MLASFERVLRISIAAVVVTLFGTAPAQAARFTGAWDPTYGVPFVGGVAGPLTFDLGWRGSVEVIVPDSCALLIGERSYGASSPCALGSSVQNASVELYDVNDPSLETKGRITFSTSSMSIRRLNFVDDELISLFTFPSSWDQAVWTSPPPPVSPFFSLLFLDPAASNLLRAPLGAWFGDVLGVRDEIPEDYFGPLLLSHSNTDFDAGIDSFEELVARLLALRNISISDVESNPPTYPNGSLFALAAPPTDIPEPGSLALIAVALFATAWAARTRRRV